MREQASRSSVRPKVIAHRGGKDHGRENDTATIVRTLAYKPDIIEIDVRKSKDGILYCHHGSVPFGYFAAQFHRHISFAKIQRLIGKRETLEEVLRVIPKDVTVCLDIKNDHITGEELLLFIDGRDVWLLVHSLKSLHAMQKALKDNVVYIRNYSLLSLYNVPAILGLSHSARMLINGQPEYFSVYNDLSKLKR